MLTTQYLIEIEAYSINKRAAETLYFSTHPLNTTGGDTPANTPYIARVSVPFSLTRNLYDGERVTGGSVPARGFTTLDNSDGHLDYLINEYSFNSRKFKIFRGNYIQGGQPRSNFTQIYQGVTEQIEFDEKSITIRLRDRLYVFDKPIQPNLFGASVNNAAEGKPIPLSFGLVTGAQPILVNSSFQQYKIHDGAISSAVVRDRGVTLSPSVNTSNGTFTLSTAPAGVVDCDVHTVSPYGGGDDVVSVFLWIVRDYAGLSLSDINTDSFDALGTTPQVGIYVNSETKITAVLDQLATTIGAFYYFDKNDQLTIGQFNLPDTLQSQEINFSPTIKFKRLPTAIPAYSAVYNFARRYRTMSKEELAGSVPFYDVAQFAEANLSRKSEDSGIKTAYPNARRLVIEGYASLNEAVFAQNEAARQFNLYRDQRDVFTITVQKPAFSFELAETIQLIYDRYSFQYGRNFRAIQITDTGTADAVELTLWGPGRGFLLREDGGVFLREDRLGYILRENY